jgi:hypothetical protein
MSEMYARPRSAGLTQKKLLALRICYSFNSISHRFYKG